MKQSKGINTYLILGILFSSVYFFILTFMKYYLNDISICYYSLNYIGNILNILLLGGLLLGFVWLILRKIFVETSKLRFVVLLLFISIVCIVIIFLLFNIFEIELKQYFLSFQLKKLLIGVLFIISAATQLYSFFYIWGIIFGKESYFELRILVRTLLGIVILVIFSFFVVWNSNNYSIEKTRKARFKFALVPGAAVWKKEKPSPIFEGRIRKAFELYKNGYIENIILVGGNAPGEISEAEAAKKYLTNLGFESNHLIVERATSTTSEQIKFLKKDSRINADNNLILIISDGFHLTRILQICKFFEVNAIGVSSGYEMTLEKTIFYRMREGIGLLIFWLFAI